MTTELSDRVDQLHPVARAVRAGDRRARAGADAPRMPGDRAIVLADGSIEGFVGGQCAAGSVRTAALGALETGESACCCGCCPDTDDAFPETPGASIVVNPCLSGGALEIYLEPLLPVTGAVPRRLVADRRGAWPPWRPRSGSSSSGPSEGARPAGATAAVVVEPRRRRGRGDPGRAGRRGRLRRAGVQPHPRARRCSRSSTCPRTSCAGCTRTSASTSGRARRRRSRCRSWPRSCAASGSRA